MTWFKRVRRRSRWQSAARLVALLVVLAGLFAMHGLADHGSGGHGAMPGAHAATHGSQPPAMEKALPIAGPAATSDEPSGEVGLVELCLAVLVALGVLAVGALLGGWIPGAAGPRAAVRWLALRARARDPVPPDLTLLCLRRC